MSYFACHGDFCPHISPELICRIQISMNNKNCSGKHLLKLCKCLKNSNAENIEFQIADTLYRHNISWQSNKNLNDSFSLSIKLGDHWMVQNSQALKYCESNFLKFRVRRWEHWRSQPVVKKLVRAIEKTYCENDGFRKSIDGEINSYFLRTKRNMTKNRFLLSKKFLIEEIAVSEYSANGESCNEIYSGDWLAPEEYLATSNDLKDQYKISRARRISYYPLS